MREEKEREKEEQNLAIVGGGAVGKTCLITRYIQNKFIEEYDPSNEYSYRKQVTIDNKMCELFIIDTNAQEEYAGMRDSYMRSASALLLCFSVTNRCSFDKLEEYQQQILRVKCVEYWPIIVVACKCDLKEREVSTREGEEMAKRFQCPYVETSAKDCLNVEKAFFDCVREYRRWFRAGSVGVKNNCFLM